MKMVDRGSYTVSSFSGGFSTSEFVKLYLKVLAQGSVY